MTDAVRRKVDSTKPGSKQMAFRSRINQAGPDDPVNRTILGELKKNARRRYVDLAKAVHLSAPAVYERVRKMEAAGLIRSFTIELDPVVLGLTFCAFIRIATHPGARCGALAPGLAQHAEVEECHSIAGEDSVLVKVRTKDPQSLEQLLQKIRSLPGVERTLTSVVLRTDFERGIQP